jgi:putative nucleotidyltransferase with HDIG domain
MGENEDHLRFAGPWLAEGSAEDSPDRNRLVVPGSPGESNSSTRQSRILLIDDDDAVREVIAKQLLTEGFHCHQAADALEAFQSFEMNRFDLALCDMRLPGLDGVEVLRRIRQFDEDLAVIMITAVADVNSAVECLRLGASDYLLKPVNWDELLIAVERALERRALVIEHRLYSRTLETQVRKRTTELANKNREMSTLIVNTIQSLVSTLEAKDTYTEGHSWKVAMLAANIARKMGMDKDFVENVSLAGLLHDIGKIGVRDQVLNKPGPLSPEEYRHVQQHPVIGERILAPVEALRALLGGIRHHHERFDGKGYPDALGAEDIPLAARILALADAYDAITSRRAYRGARSHNEALEIIREEVEAQFDPELVAILLQLRPEDWKTPGPLTPIPQDDAGGDAETEAPDPE